MLRPNVSSGWPADVDLNPYSATPWNVNVPKRWSKRWYAQSVVIERSGTAPVQWERCSSKADCEAFGATPQSGSARCHAWSPQYDPSGALHAATPQASGVPS